MKKDWVVLSSFERHCPYKIHVLSTIKITITCGIQNTPKPKLTKEVAVILLQWPRHSQPDDMRRIKGKHLLLPFELGWVQECCGNRHDDDIAKKNLS